MITKDGVKISEGISGLSDSYQGFLIDQFGVLHNGEALFPETLETLRHLKARHKQIILISNSGRMAAQNIQQLEAMGLTQDYYDNIVTSAEATRQNLDKPEDSLFKNIGKKCYLMSRKGNTYLIDDLKAIEQTVNLNEADFILLTGSDAPEKTFENYYDAILKEASRLNIKMICANPEKTMTIQGQQHFGSGEIARRYEEVGGVVTYIGKPFPALFQHALKLFDNLYPSQVCVIGDSFAADMRGARYLDLDCALIASGMHSGSFSKVSNTNDISKMLSLLGKNHGVMPTYFVPRFHWGKDLPDRKNKLRKS